ncbi:HNH endonuclease [Scytonema sp. HK-05]|nr:HNH endonuclease [Scytonema sp. HK-05]
MSKVFVIDSEKRPLNLIHPAQARQLLRNKKAAVYRQFPFTLILFESRPETSNQPLRLKIDPGAKHTGIALVNDSTGEVVFAAELKHRGFAIRDALTLRRQLRRSRRNRKTRYRKPRFLNRTRPKGWLAPSVCIAGLIISKPGLTGCADLRRMKPSVKNLCALICS